MRKLRVAVVSAGPKGDNTRLNSNLFSDKNKHKTFIEEKL